MTVLPAENIPKDFYRQYERPTCNRRIWVFMSWFFTWWVPVPLMRLSGLRRADVRQAWREKVTICIFVLLACASTLFMIIGLPKLLCPRVQVISKFEVELFDKPTKPYISAYGRYYDIKDIYESHVDGTLGVEKFRMQGILGQDVSQMFFPARNWDKSCPGIKNPGDTWDNLLERTPEKFWPHYAADPKTGIMSNYLGSIEKHVKGRIGWQRDYLSKMSKEDSARKVIIMYENVYDIAAYFTAPESFFDENMNKIFSTFAGKTDPDATKVMEALLKQPRSENYYKSVINCMNKMFYIGTIDRRLDIRCVLSNYILVSLSAVMALVIFLKFVFAIIGARPKNNPEEIKKGVIIQVPCYTEGSEELKGTFESIAKSDYDEENKMMVVVCDGIITGGGNDKSTPELVLGILFNGEDQPEAEMLSYEAVAEGKRGYNRAQLYGGIYEHKGNRLPFIVIVKCGMPNETQKPGNRGKRDSQVMLKRFLNRVYSGQPMVPFELELYHQFLSVVGRNPKEYEYLCFVDADTQLEESSLNRLVTTMVSDRDIIGMCGVTRITNPKENFVTKIQVYEYFISHYMGKAFESCFGSVTCLPGCFSLYRIRNQDFKNPKLYIVAPKIIEEYSVTRVNTLHMRNLYHLGEDRFLTTLMLKHFPSQKTVMVPDAFCYTNVPDSWEVFLSQRRRWINSTIHNLWELAGLSQLAGCLCFGLRFVIILELIAAIVGPATIFYLFYLCYTIIFENELMPLVSIIMLGAIYGLQAIIVLIHTEPEHLYWMVIYVLATFPIPALSLVLPLYSFWKMDDFSWGSTRVILGQNGTVEEAADEGDFDPSKIPRRRWNEYKKERDDAEAASEEKSMRKAMRHAERVAAASIIAGGSQVGYAPSYHPGVHTIHDSPTFSSVLQGGCLPTPTELFVLPQPMSPVMHPSMAPVMPTYASSMVMGQSVPYAPPPQVQYYSPSPYGNVPMPQYAPVQTQLQSVVSGYASDPYDLIDTQSSVSNFSYLERKRNEKLSASSASGAPVAPVAPVDNQVSQLRRERRARRHGKSRLRDAVAEHSVTER